MKNKLLILLFGLGLAFRLVLVPSAYHGDLNNNWSWGQVAVERGLSGFYGKDSNADNWEFSAPNQPPLYILYFATVYRLHSFVNTFVYWVNDSIPLFPSSLVWWWETNGKIYSLKIGSVLADVGIGLVIYNFLKSKTKNKSLAHVGASAIWLFNPVTFYNSAIWGQTDPIVNLLGLLAIVSLLKKHFTSFTAWFVAALLFKPSLAIFVPVLILVIVKQRYTISQLGQGIIYSAVLVVFTSLWFHPYYDMPLWLYKLYTVRILPGEIGHLTANAFNFWWLVNPGKMLDSTMYFGLAARVWGYMMGGGLIAWIVYLMNKSKLTDKKVMFALMLSVFASFLFFTRIHERYLYPLFPLATLLLGLINKLKWPYVVLSVGFLLNMYHLFWAPDAINLKWLFASGQLQSLISSINIGVFVYLINQFFKHRLTLVKDN